MTYQITDTITNDTITVNDAIDMALAIRSMFLTDDDDILATIGHLVEKVEHGDDTSDEEQYLGIEITCC